MDMNASKHLMLTRDPSFQVAGVVSSIIVLITVWKLGPLFEDLPKVILSLTPVLVLSNCPEFWRMGLRGNIFLCLCSSGCSIYNSVGEFKRNVQAVHRYTHAAEVQQGWSGTTKSPLTIILLHLTGCEPGRTCWLPVFTLPSSWCGW